jgi:hemolysin activation/secretion protein
MISRQNPNSSRLSLAITLALSATGAFAQVKPGIGDALRQVPAPLAPPTAPAPQLGGVTEAKPPMTALASGPTVLLKKVEVVGNRVIDAATLHALVADAEGQPQTLSQLEALAIRVTRHYRAAGYFVARAYIPEQEVSDGTVTIRVIEGNYGQFILKNQSLVRDSVVQGLLDDVKDRDIVSLDTLERAMLIINDTPGVQVVRADVMPGQAVGTSDFAVDAVAGARVNGYATLDNHGSVYTGKGRLSFGADWNSPTGRGDRLSASGLLSEASNLTNGRLAYSSLLLTNGTRGELSFSQTNYELTDAFASLDAVGRARSVALNLSTPVKRSRNQTVELGLNLVHSDLLDEQRATGVNTPKRSRAVTGTLNSRAEHAFLGAFGLTQANAAFTLGNLDINSDTDRSLDAAGARTQGKFAKIQLGLTRTSLLPQSFQLLTSVRAQWSLSHKNLDGSERMSISGVGGVMALPSGESSGDNAALARVELSRPLPALGGLQLNVSAFTDYGWAAAANPLPGAGDRELSDLGLGVSGRWRGAFFRVEAAHGLSGGPAVSEPAPRTKVLAQVGWTF